MRGVPAVSRLGGEPPGRRLDRALSDAAPRTLSIPVRHAQAETSVRGSRFRAWLGPAVDVEAANRALADRTAAGPDATHHCWAFRLWHAGAIEDAAFDAGEPGGTAGRPILGALQRAGLVQAVCVVSRWFGGVRLGTGGLVRAYAEAARAAILAGRETGAIVEARPRAPFRVGFTYPHSGGVQRVIARFDARALRSRYDERVELELDVAAESAAAFSRALVDATGGAIEVLRLELRLEPVPG